MNRNVPSPRMREFAEQLIAFEAAANNGLEPSMPAMIRVFEALRKPIGKLAGSSGFRVLLARALVLAKGHVPSLSEVYVEPDGSLKGLSKFFSNEDPETGVVLTAQLLGLLATFIGEGLMLRLLLDVWPTFTVPATEPSRATEHDRTR